MILLSGEDQFSWAKLTKETAKLLKLSGKQKQEIDWQEDEGEEPKGG